MSRSASVTARVGAPADIVESVDRIEPARLDEPSAAIIDFVAETSGASAVLGLVLHPRPPASLAAVVRL